MKRLIVLCLLFPGVSLADTPAPLYPHSGNIIEATCPYPSSLISSHAEGLTVIHYDAASDGTLQNVRVATSSGNVDLDDAALKCTSASHFDPSGPMAKFTMAAHQTGVLWSNPRAAADSTSNPPIGKRVFIGRPHTCDAFYPPNERALGIEGVTILHFVVDEGGGVRDPVVDHSSGNTALDNAALKCVLVWRYWPAQHDGKPASAQVKAEIKWSVPHQLPE